MVWMIDICLMREWINWRSVYLPLFKWDLLLSSTSTEKVVSSEHFSERFYYEYYFSSEDETSE